MANLDKNKRHALYKLLKDAPKPQLHLHLDGSISYNFVKKSMKRMKQREPERYERLFPAGLDLMTEDELLEWVWKNKEQQRVNGDVADEDGTWRVFAFCEQFVQTKEDLIDATYDLVTRMYYHYNVNYIEVRFGPKLHTKCGLTQREVVDSVLEGFNNAKDDILKSGIEIGGGIILCAVRQFMVEDASLCLDLVHDTDALAFDIAGDEGSFPLSSFKHILEKGKDLDIPMTIHAGEWNYIEHPSVLENLRIVADIGVDRIGHGLAITHASEDVIRTIKQKGISIEVCLTGNCGNKSRCNSFKEHPLPKMLEMGLKVAALNCDDTLVEGSKEVGVPEPIMECIRALIDVKINPEDLVSIIENGYKSGFAKSANVIGDKSIKLWRDKYLPGIKDILKEN